MTTKEGVEITLLLSEDLQRKLEFLSELEGKDMEDKVRAVLLSYFDDDD